MDWSYIALFVFLAAAFYTDWKYARIPNNLVVAGASVGIFGHLLMESWPGLFFALQGLAVGFVVLLLLYFFGAVAAGDVKLFGAMGALVGTVFTISTLFYAVFYACAIGIVLIILRGELLESLKKTAFLVLNFFMVGKCKVFQDYKEKGSFRFPFMYAVLPGTVTAFCYKSIIEIFLLS